MTKFLLSGLLLITGVLACASRGTLFSFGPRPAEIVGVWIDVAQTSKTDTIAWVLAADGDDQTMRLVVHDSAGKHLAKVRETWNGWWYVTGKLSDSKHRAICCKRRPRDGATCLRFRLDTLSILGAERRRLTILGYPNDDWPQPRIFVGHRP